jgi:hypothetical protein
MPQGVSDAYAEQDVPAITISCANGSSRHSRTRCMKQQAWLPAQQQLQVLACWAPMMHEECANVINVRHKCVPWHALAACSTGL